MNDQAKIGFASRYNREGEKETMFQSKNPQFKYKDSNQRAAQSFQNVRSYLNKPEPMEIDKSSVHVNVEAKSNPTKGRFNAAFKREFKKNESHASSEQQRKFQRINNVEEKEEANYARSLFNDHHPSDVSDAESEENKSVSSTCVHFLGV